MPTILLVAGALTVAACQPKSPTDDSDATPERAVHVTALAELNDGPCRPGQVYVQEELREPMKIGAHDANVLETELVVRIRERCVPVWVQPAADGGQPRPRWEMQTLRLRTYGFPRKPGIVITEEDADDPGSPKIAWSAPGPTFVVKPATRPGAADGTNFKVRLYNRMPHAGDPHACQTNLKCNTTGSNPGVDPDSRKCRTEPNTDDGGFPPFVPSQTVDGKVIEPPNCFHGPNSTNLHFHGFHVSPQLGQDFVGLELRPPMPNGMSNTDMPQHGPHGEKGFVEYGHFDFNLDRLRYTQPPGTHWYHAHKHGSTALQVLNGLVGTFEVRGEFDENLERYFETKGGGKLVDRLILVQQLQEQQPGLGGADQNLSVLVNGQANPIVKMAKGEIQRWRFVGATMQASAALRVGFPDVSGKPSPEVRQIAMDGVQFSRRNYTCQPFLNNPDCSPEKDETEFVELTSFALSPGNRIDVLVKAPPEAGTHCMVLDITTGLHEDVDATIRGAHAQRAAAVATTCGLDENSLGPLFTLIVEDREKPMTFPTEDQFPQPPRYLDDIPAVEPELHKDVYYQMVQQGKLNRSQFWISQQKYDGACANETLTLNVPEQWTLWNNSGGIAHPFHIHQNPFQLLSETRWNSDPNKDLEPIEFAHPVWRDTLAIPKARTTVDPNTNPTDTDKPWGHAVIRYVAKEFTGSFVNHCHILGHEDRGMMHNTQASCPDGHWAKTGGAIDPAKCDAQGFCPGDCETGERIPAATPCPEPPLQQSDWPSDYGHLPGD